MSTFTLAISWLTTSNLPWFMALTFQAPMQYRSLQHRTLLLPPVTSTTGYCFCFGSIPAFFLELFLHWSPVAYGHLLTWGVPLSVSYLFAFSYSSWGSQGKNTEVVCHSLLQGTTLCQTSPPWPARLGWPHTAWLSFTELAKAVILGSDWLVFCDYGFRLSALWCPLATPTVSLGFLLPWTWGISSRLLQQSAVAAPYFGRRVSSHGCPPDLGRGVAPLGRRPWPCTWGSCSRPPPLHCRSLALSVATPDLGWGLAPHSLASTRVHHSRRASCTVPLFLRTLHHSWGSEAQDLFKEVKGFLLLKSIGFLIELWLSHKTF